MSMTRLTHLLALTAMLLSAATTAFAQRPGDRIEYRAEHSPEKWEVGTYVGMAGNGTQAIIREKPSEFFPEGFQRAYDLKDIRPTSKPAPRPMPAPRPAAPWIPAPAPPYAPVPMPAAPTPTPTPVPAPVVRGLSACGARPDPVSNRFECVQQVAQGSPNWGSCQAGDEVACHRFVREVVRELATGDPRWGLITKPRGQSSCTERVCGADGGFGGDVVAYLPEGSNAQQWLGSDIVAGAGAPGARPQWMQYEGGSAMNRPDNLWTRLPQ